MDHAALPGAITSEVGGSVLELGSVSYSDAGHKSRDKQVVEPVGHGLGLVDRRSRLELGRAESREVDVGHCMLTRRTGTDRGVTTSSKVLCTVCLIHLSTLTHPFALSLTDKALIRRRTTWLGNLRLDTTHHRRVAHTHERRTVRSGNGAWP